MKLKTIYFYFLINVLLINGCLDYSLINILSNKGDPDIIITDEDDVPFFRFQIRSQIIDGDSVNTSKYKTFIYLENQNNIKIFEGYIENNKNIVFSMNKDSVYTEGFYCVKVEVKENKFGNIIEYGKLIFYYTGSNGIQKEIITYPVD